MKKKPKLTAKDVNKRAEQKLRDAYSPAAATKKK